MNHIIKLKRNGKEIEVDIKNMPAIDAVIEERKKFNVNLVSFDKELVRTPTNKDAFLPRYNKLLIEVAKTEASSLKELTIKFFRTGSKIGSDNAEYITIDVDGLKEGIPQKVIAYLFDAYNLPFDNIVALHEPNIDLNAPMRGKFREILPFLDEREMWGKDYKLNMGM